LEDFFKIGPLQGFTSKEPGTKEVFEFSHKMLGLVDAGPIGFPNNMTMSHGPWPDPQTGARRGIASTTPNPSRIGQISQISTESNFCI
jgi:hypothetical protein